MINRKHVMPKKFVKIAYICLLALFLTGCNGEGFYDDPVSPTPGATSGVSGTVTGNPGKKDPDATKAPAVTTPDPGKKSAPYGILTRITHEAGTKLTPEEFISGYEGTVTVLTAFSEEDLLAVGASFAAAIDCDGREVTVIVDISDNAAPVFKGIQDIEINEGDTIAYKKGVSAYDNVDGEVSFSVDNSNVDTDKAGIYTVTYSATDRAGNMAEVTAKVTVNALRDQLQILIDDKADEVIRSVVTDNMTKREKAYAVFVWCHTNLTYKGEERDLTYDEAAYAGLFDHAGDCYVSYVLLDVLYKRMGFETMMVERVGGTSDHFWNYVNYGEGWYHCDCIKRRTGNKAFDDYWCFMQTDSQVEEYNKLRGDTMPNCYTYDKSAFPECDKFKIYDGNTHEFIPDKEAPVINGAMDLFIARGETVAYKKNIKVTDNSGEDITVHVKNSGVNLNVVGIYPITYYAEDSSGNRSEVSVNLHVCEPSAELAYDIADTLLANITNDKMSQYDKAKAIYFWIAYHIAYVDAPTGTDPLLAAYDGLTKYKGGCYVYANVAQLLLTRAGIENIMIVKYPVYDEEHFWSIVNVGDGWYHFDSTPWWDGTQIFMWTESQLEKFSKRNDMSHAYDKSLYPEVVQ